MQPVKVLFLPASYPSEINPIAGIFIKEHAKAASLYNDIVVLYTYPDPSPQLRGLYRISESVEDGISTTRVRYGGVFLNRWLKGKRQQRAVQVSLTPKSKSLHILSQVLVVPQIIIGKLLYYWGIFAAFRKLIKGGWKPDIIHAHFFTAGALAVILGRMYRIPVVITEHSTNVATNSLSALERKRLRFAMKRAQAILPVSNDLGSAIKNYYGINKRVQVVPNVVNTEVFYPSAYSTKKNKAQKKMLLVAVLAPRKGISYLLEALSQIKDKRQDFVLNVVGEGPNRSEYEQLAKDWELNNVVKFHGRQPEIASFMRECDFFVLPSLYENFGVVYAEAMACGKPVIATNAGGPREIVNEDVGILVPPKDVEALREAIEYMLDNYQSYSPEEIVQYARERFSYEAVGQMLDQVYKSITKEKA